jgi:predicted methyltransferase
MRHKTFDRSRIQTFARRLCSETGRCYVTAPLAFVCLLLVVGCSRAQNSGPERDRWQRPDEVLDALGVKSGSIVADVGCGRGYFAMKLAARVGPTGKVYAEDIKDDVLEDVHHDAEKQGLKQITTVLGAPDDPHLPSDSLDVVLTVDSYHEWVNYDSMLKHLYAALKPGGLFGLIDGETKPGRSRDDYHSMHRMPESMEREDLISHGFHFLRSEPGFTRPSDGKTYYFLIFQK